MNPYWICVHLNLIKIRHKSLLKIVNNFSVRILTELCASKASQISTWIFTENCRQFFRINTYWICGHLKLVKIRHETLLKFVDFFSAWIIIEFVQPRFLLNLVQKLDLTFDLLTFELFESWPLDLSSIFFDLWPLNFVDFWSFDFFDLWTFKNWSSWSLIFSKVDLRDLWSVWPLI